MVSDSADAMRIVSKDLNEFLKSDSDQIPQSLKQLSKIARSNELSESLADITRALAVGILRAYQHEMIKGSIGNSFGGDKGFSDRALDKLFSDAGSGFASVVVGSFAKNLVTALYTEWQQDCVSNVDGFPNAVYVDLKSSQYVPSWGEAFYDGECRELIGDFIRIFVTTAVTVYLDKTMNLNAYDEFFHGLTNSKHEARVRDMLVSVCNGAVQTCIRTSHHVWTASSVAVSKANPTYSKTEYEDIYDGREKSSIRTKLVPWTLQARKLTNKNQESGLVRKMRSTLAVPSNRKLVRDMTRIVTSETVRSFLELLFEKSGCIKRNVDVVHQEAVDRGFDTIRYMSGRSSAVTTLASYFVIGTH